MYSEKTSDDLMDPRGVRNISSKGKHLTCMYSSRYEAQSILTRILSVCSFPFVVTNFDAIFDTNECGNTVYI